jgi:hypothetical protein
MASKWNRYVNTTTFAVVIIMLLRRSGFYGICLVVSVLSWVYSALHFVNTFKSIYRVQEQHTSEAVRLQEYCNVASSDFTVLANCASVRRLVLSPPGVLEALEDTTRVVLNEITAALYEHTSRAVMMFGITGALVVSSLGVLTFFVDRTLTSWWMRRQLMHQYKQFSNFNTNRQHLGVSMPMFLPENPHID